MTPTSGALSAKDTPARVLVGLRDFAAGSRAMTGRGRGPASARGAAAGLGGGAGTVPGSWVRMGAASGAGEDEEDVAAEDGAPDASGAGVTSWWQAICNTTSNPSDAGARILMRARQ